MSIVNKWLDFRQGQINKRNQGRLINKEITIIASNCAGGFFYHWLDLRFNSPFINLFMTNDDFLFAMNHFDEFIQQEISEDHNSGKSYPVGIGYGNVRIHFMHYDTFDNALKKWNERVKRINRNNICVMLTNWNGNDSIVKQFEELPFKRKVIFTNKKYPDCNSCFCISKWTLTKNGKPNNIWRTLNLVSGKRYIDQFDYISFFNGD